MIAIIPYGMKKSLSSPSLDEASVVIAAAVV